MEESRGKAVVRTGASLYLSKMDKQKKFLQSHVVFVHGSAISKGVHGGFNCDVITATLWSELSYIEANRVLPG
jgi:hypothetical protein